MSLSSSTVSAKTPSAGVVLADPVLKADGLGKTYPVRRSQNWLARSWCPSILNQKAEPPSLAVTKLRAVDGVSFELKRGKTLAVVGESGCGKSTLARLLLRLESPSFGSLSLLGRSADAWPEAEYRRKIQMIFQDPYSSLNPRRRAIEIVEEPLAVNLALSARERRERAGAMLLKTGLHEEHFQRYPHMFSGGQRQRIGIARALILRPEIVVCDEPVSALDVSIQAQVLNLLMDLQDEFGLSYIFISHDLAVVRHIADEVMVMYLGRVMERGSREQIFSRPRHPYTQALLASTPSLVGLGAGPAAERVRASGDLPSPLRPPPGCPFQSRCPRAVARCASERPELRPSVDESGRGVACHLVETVA